MREYRIAEPDGSRHETRDPLAADDAHCRGAVVLYRDHGPHETPGPWRVYATGEYAEG